VLPLLGRVYSCVCEQTPQLGWPIVEQETFSFARWPETLLGTRKEVNKLRLNDLVSYSSDAVSMYTHCGTQIDALNHFGYYGTIFNNFKAEDHLGSRHWDGTGFARLVLTY
jgi:hypothetical protein